MSSLCGLSAVFVGILTGNSDALRPITASGRLKF